MKPEAPLVLLIVILSCTTLFNLFCLLINKDTHALNFRWPTVTNAVYLVFAVWAYNSINWELL